MKKLNIFLTLPAMALVAFTGWLWFQTKEQASEIQTLQKDAQQHAQKIQVFEKQRKELKKETKTLMGELQMDPAFDGSLEDAEAASKSAASQKKYLGSIKQMIDNPEMKEMIRQQQREMYGSFFKESALTTEEEEVFLNIFSEYSDKSMATFSNAESLTQTSKMAKKLLKEQEQELEKLLGKVRFAEYQRYSKTLYDRMAFDQFESQLAQTKTPLESAQSDELMKIVLEESLQNPDGNFFASSQMLDNPKETLSDDAISSAVQRRKETYQKIVDRSNTFLNADQQKALAAFYEKQLDNIEMTMKMSRKALSIMGKTEE